MEPNRRLGRARVARGVPDLDRDALRRRQSRGSVGPRSDDSSAAAKESTPKTPESPESPKSTKSTKPSTSALPQATQPPSTAPQASLPMLPPPSESSAPPADLIIPPPPATTSQSTTSARRAPNPPVATVPLPRPPPIALNPISVSTTQPRVINPPVSTVPLPKGFVPPPPPKALLPPAVQNPAAEVTPSRGPIPPASTVDLPFPQLGSASTVDLPFPTVSLPFPLSGPGATSKPTTMLTSTVPTLVGGMARETAPAAMPASSGSPGGVSAPVQRGGAYPQNPTYAAEISNAVTTALPLSSAAVPAPAPAVKGDGGAGLHAGIALGSLAGGCLLAAIMFYLSKLYRRHRDKHFLDKPYATSSGTNGSSPFGVIGSRVNAFAAPSSSKVAGSTNRGAAAGAAVGASAGAAGVAAYNGNPQFGPNGEPIDPKTQSQILNDMFQAVYAAENGAAGSNSDQRSMNSEGYPIDEKQYMAYQQELQQQQYEAEQMQAQTSVSSRIGSWLRGTRPPSSQGRASWASRFTAPSWTRSSTASSFRASAAWPAGFRPASPLPPLPPLPAEVTSNVNNKKNNNTIPNAGMVSRWSDSTRQTPPSPSTVRQSEALDSNSNFYSMYQQRDTDVPPVPDTPSAYQLYRADSGGHVRANSNSLPPLTTSGDAMTGAAKKETRAFEVSPLSPESAASTSQPDPASPGGALLEPTATRANSRARSMEGGLP